MTVEIIWKRIKKHFEDKKMSFECLLIDIASDAEVMKYNRNVRLKKVWVK
jgi:hypothetical protein